MKTRSWASVLRSPKIGCDSIVSKEDFKASESCCSAGVNEWVIQRQYHGHIAREVKTSAASFDCHRGHRAKTKLVFCCLNRFGSWEILAALCELSCESQSFTVPPRYPFLGLIEGL